MRNRNLPSGEVALKVSVVVLSVIYFLGISVCLLLLRTNFLNECLSWIGMLFWGMEVKKFREFIERFPVIGCLRGQWFLRPQNAGLTDNIRVSLNFNSVIIPGLLLLSFQDGEKQFYSFFLVPSMVGGVSKFSWLSRYAKLTPVF